jgi:trans-aconitate 2-methyltransferase
MVDTAESSDKRTPQPGPLVPDWDASAYHRLAQPQFNWGQRVSARLPLQGDETVMDAGCGTGRLTAELLDRLPHGQVIAVDRSATMLREAQAYLRPRFGERVQFLQADLLKLQVSEAVDAILSTATFHWIADHPCLFRNLYRALKPGGWLEAQCGGGPNLARLLQRASVLLAADPYARFFVGWAGPWEYADEGTTADRLRAAGFVEVETSLEPAPTLLANRQEYAEFLTSVIFGTHLARIPDQTLRVQFVTRLTEQAAQDDPPFLLDYWRLNLRGRRPAPASSAL